MTHTSKITTYNCIGVKPVLETENTVVERAISLQTPHCLIFSTDESGKINGINWARAIQSKDSYPPSISGRTLEYDIIPGSDNEEYLTILDRDRVKPDQAVLKTDKGSLQLCTILFYETFREKLLEHLKTD